MLQPIALPLQIVLLLLTGLAAYFDVRTRRVPNWLSLAGCLLGFAMNKAPGNIYGLAIGFGLYLPLWLLGARGAGDVKLLAAAGSLIGPANTFALFLLAAVMGGVLGLALVLTKGATKQTLWNIIGIFHSLVHLKKPVYTLASPGVLRLPHALVIFLAAAVEVVILRGVRSA